MKRSPLTTPEITAFIRENRDKYNCREMAEIIRRKFSVDATYSAMRAFRNNHRLHGSGKIKGMRAGSSEAVFTAEQKHAIAWLCTTHSDSELSALFKDRFGLERTPQQFKSFRRRSGIKSGRTGHFHTEENPYAYIATKGEHLSPATEFRRGQRPANYMPVGSETVNGEGYRIVKVSDKGTQMERWAFKSRLVWEAAHGRIPEGGRIIHIDGDPLNDSLENLRLIDNAALLEVNRAGGLDCGTAELNNAKISVAVIATKTRRRK